MPQRKPSPMIAAGHRGGRADFVARVSQNNPAVAMAVMATQLVVRDMPSPRVLRSRNASNRPCRVTEVAQVIIVAASERLPPGGNPETHANRFRDTIPKSLTLRRSRVSSSLGWRRHGPGFPHCG
jgi:hypothetical protein